MSKKFKSRRVCIALITDSEDNVLMGIRKDSGKWANIGGRAENKEDPYCAMVRELKEESGLDAKKIKLIESRWNIDKNLLIYLYKIEIDRNQPIDMSKDPDEEFKEIRFVDPNEIVEDLQVPLEENIAIKYWMDN